MGTPKLNDEEKSLLAGLGDRRLNFLGMFEIYKDAAQRRGRILADSMDYQTFRRDAAELRAWMQEKLDVLNEASSIQPANVEGRSQKAEALKAELDATRKTLDNLNGKGKQMADKGHFASDSIQDILEDLNRLYFELMRKSKQRDDKLVDIKKLSDYYTMCDEIMVWINEKNNLVRSIISQIESNPYKFSILDKKHNDFEKELLNHRPEIDEMHEKAEVLLEKMPQEKEKILERRDEILNELQELRNTSIEAKNKIESAKQIQNFLRDSDEMVDFLKEKRAQTPLENFGEDLEQTKALQRRHDNVERDLIAISNGVTALCKTADKLSVEQPNFESQIKARKSNIDTNWEVLKEYASERKMKLGQQFNWFSFLFLYDSCVYWIRDKTRQVEDEQLPDNPEDAKNLLSHLSDTHITQFKTEQTEIVRCCDLADAMAEQEHPKAEEVQKMRDKLRALCDSLEELLTETKVKYRQCIDYLELKRDADQCEASLKKFSVILDNGDVGDSVDAAESLIAKLQSQFHSKYNPQKEMVSHLQSICSQMVDNEHYDAQNIELISQKLGELRDSIFSKYESLRKRLDFSLQFQLFSRDADAYLLWIGDRARVIGKDQGFKTTTDLTASVQSIKALESEVKLYEEKIEDVVKLGKELVENEAFKKDMILQKAYESVNSKLQRLQGDLERLHQLIKDRQEKLKEALESQKYYRMADEFELWRSTVEAQLSSREPGKDLNSCMRLMTHHEVIEQDVRQHREALEHMYTLSKAFNDADHFDKDNIRSRQEKLQKGYVSLKGPLKEHKEWLEDAMKLHKFYREIDDVHSWITEHEPLIGNVTIGKDFIGAIKLKKKHAKLLTEMDSYKKQLEEVLLKADQLTEDDHFASDAIKKEKENLRDRWTKLEKVGDSRDFTLGNSIQAHDYFLEANESENWIREKQNNLNAQVGLPWPRNVDALISESKRHGKVLAEVEKYRPHLEDLRRRAEKCNIGPELKDFDEEDDVHVRTALVIIPYKSDAPRHLSLKQREVVTILEQFPDNLIKVENEEGYTGLVPAQHLKEEETTSQLSKSGSRERLMDFQKTVLEKQDDIENRFNRLMGELKSRQKKLNDRLKMSQLMTQASALRNWIDTKSDKKIIDDNLQVDDEDAIAKALKKAGKFVKKLDTNKNSIGTIGQEIMSLGAEDPELQEEVIQAVNNVKVLENKAMDMFNLASDEAAKLETAHEVKQYLRDCDDLLDRINDKDNSLVVGHFGTDLHGNDILVQKHAAFQNDINAFVEAAKALENKSHTLLDAHPESGEEVDKKLDEVANKLDDLQTKSDNHMKRLNEMTDYLKFGQEFDDALNWIEGMNELLEEDLANDVNSAHAQLERHNDLMHEMDARSPQINKIEQYMKVLKHHPEHDKVKEKVKNIHGKLADLRNKYEQRGELLGKNVDFQEMNKEFKQNQLWMEDREHRLEDETDSQDLHEDIDRLVNFQETKIIQTLTKIEDLYEQAFRVPDLKAKKSQLQSKWVEVRGKLMRRKEEIQHEKSVVATLEDLDELQNWVDMRRPAAEASTQEDDKSSHIKKKYEKQKAFDAEVEANQDRVQSMTDLVKAKLDSKKTSEEQKKVLREKLQNVAESFEYLYKVTVTKTLRLKEANRQRLYYTAYEDFIFWLKSVEAQYGDLSYGHDLATVANQRKRHGYFEDDVKVHEERLTGLNNLADECIAAEQFDPEEIEEKREDVNSRFEKVKEFTSKKKEILEQAFNFFKLISEIAMEQTWITEKSIVLAKSTDYGQNLPGVENLIKRHKRLKLEMETHSQVSERLQPVVAEIVQNNLIGSDTVQSRFVALLDQWEEFCVQEEKKENLLTQSRMSHELIRDIEELRMWISEKKVLMEHEDFGDNLASVAGLRKKHEALLKDIGDHESKGKLLNKRSDKLIAEGNMNANAIKFTVDLLWNDFKALRKLWSVRNENLLENSAYLQFIWKTDVIDSWINDKKVLIESDDIWKTPIRTMSDVIVLNHKHEAFKRSLNTFANDNIRVIQDLHEKVLNAVEFDAKELGFEFQGSLTPENKQRISHSFKTIMNRWESLNQKSEGRHEELGRYQQYYQAIEDQFLLFAKKASNFNSWFENAEEDLREPIKCHSIDEVRGLMEAHGEFADSLQDAQTELEDLRQLDAEINQEGNQYNPYTWFTIEAINETWSNLLQRIKFKKRELDEEFKRQEAKEEIRKQFAREANAFHDWVVSARERIMNESGGIDEQLDDIKAVSAEVVKQKSRLKSIEELGLRMKDQLILDNRYTEHNTLGLGQAWAQLDNLCQSMQHNLEQQRNAKENAGVKESTLNDFTKMFRHHDKDRLGELKHEDLKSCLRALGYDLPILEEGVDDPEFEQILDIADRERKGFVTLPDFMHFLIMKETDVVNSKEEILDAFEILDTDAKMYFTPSELQQYLDKVTAEYCIGNMKPFVDKNGCLVENSLDYHEFCNRLFYK